MCVCVFVVVAVVVLAILNFSPAQHESKTFW